MGNWYVTWFIIFVAFKPRTQFVCFSHKRLLISYLITILVFQFYFNRIFLKDASSHSYRLNVWQQTCFKNNFLIDIVLLSIEHFSLGFLSSYADVNNFKEKSNMLDLPNAFLKISVIHIHYFSNALSSVLTISKKIEIIPFCFSKVYFSNYIVHVSNIRKP